MFSFFLKKIKHIKDLVSYKKYQHERTS